MKYLCPDCKEKYDTIRVCKKYSYTEEWETYGDVDINGEEIMTEREELTEDDNGQGKLENTKYICEGCDFETENKDDFKIVKEMK